MQKLVVALLLSVFVSASAYAERSIGDFKGDTLVVGSTSANDPNKYTIALENADLIGASWDSEFITQSLPKQRFTKIIFLHEGEGQSRNYEAMLRRNDLATAYKGLLIDGGEIIFQKTGSTVHENKRSINDFTGDTLVIGSANTGDLMKFTIDISGGDLLGSGWDRSVIEKLPKERFNQIIFENVGVTFASADTLMPVMSWSVNLAKAYRDLLKDGGIIRFQSFRYIFNQKGFGFDNLPARTMDSLDSDPITVVDGHLKFLQETTTDTPFRVELAKNNILTGNNPLHNVCMELYQAGFHNIFATAETGGLVVTAQK